MWVDYSFLLLKEDQQEWHYSHYESTQSKIENTTQYILWYKNPDMIKICNICLSLVVEASINVWNWLIDKDATLKNLKLSSQTSHKLGKYCQRLF